MRNPPQWALSATLSLILVLGTATLFARVQKPADSSADGQSEIPSVTVTGHRELDPNALEHTILPKFVLSHSSLSGRTHQIGRWQEEVCPDTFGLQSDFEEYVSRRIKTVAEGVGAPGRSGLLQCAVNVQIVFTSRAKEQLANVAESRPDLLGYAQLAFRRQATMTHAIQAWYLTTTHVDQMRGVDTGVIGETQAEAMFGVVIGIASRFADVRSDIRHVLVIVDTTKLRGYSQRTVADYIAMLVLTRTDQDGCSDLPSILDLLSDNCGLRDKPESITDADVAYLRALYSSHLSMKVNLERVEVRDRMLKILNNSADATVAVAPEDLDKHAGYYQFPAGQLMAVRRDSGALVAQVFGELPVPVMPRTPLEFAAVVPKEQIRFLQDVKLTTTGLVLHHDDIEATAARVELPEVRAHVEAQRVKIKNQTAEAGGEATLRSFIEGLRSGKPAYGVMAPTLASLTRGQLRVLHKTVAKLGDVLSVRFRGVDIEGYDTYDVSQKKGELRWRLAFGPNGTLADAVIGPADVDWITPSSIDWQRQKLN